MYKKYPAINLKLANSVSYDVAVVGGGCAGVVAGLSAAYNGARTLIVERTGYLGGMLTGGLVTSLHGYRLHRNYVGGLPMTNWLSPLLVKGITLDVAKRLQEANGTANHDHYGDPSVRENFDEEIMIHILDKMTKEAGVTVLFNTIGFDVVKENDTVQGIIIANKSGPQLIKTGVVVDASGDADIAARAGADYEQGTKEGHLTHGIAMNMEIGGIDLDRLLDYLRNRPEPTGDQLEIIRREQIELINGGTPSPDTILSLDGKRGKFDMSGRKQNWAEIDKARAGGKHLTLPGIDNEWLQYVKAHPEIPYMPNTTTLKRCYPRSPIFSWFGLVRDGKVRYDQTQTGILAMLVDQTNEEEISKAIILNREINWIYLDFFKKMIPGFEEAYIIKISPQVGSRESRRIIGEYMLKASDCEIGVRFKDAVAQCGRAINVHNLNGQGGLWYWVEPKDTYDIPYRCLVPRLIDNLLVAGRCSSVDFVALGATRSMPTCMSMGEAAGAAAALSVREKVRPRDLDIALLQKSLRAQGVLLA